MANRQWRLRARGVGGAAAVVTLASTEVGLPFLVLLGILLIVLPVVGIVLHEHGHDAAMAGMTAGTAGSLVGALVAVTGRLWLGHSVTDPGMTMATAAMAGMVGGTLVGAPDLC